MTFLSELKRRNVLRMAVLYVVAAWLIMQVAEVLIALANLPDRVGPVILAVLAIGFPIAVILSWFYELTPEGLALDKDADPSEQAAHIGGRRVDFVIIAMLAAAVLMFAWDKWWPKGPMQQSIAVLPFENLSGDAEQEYFSDGISEEILNLLAQMEPLKVIARTSSFSFKDKDVDVATIADQLNVSHVLEGSVRRSGGQLRITAQLIDAADSTHVWSQTYDRELGDILRVQDEIATAISRALEVQLVPDISEPRKPATVSSAGAEAYDAYLKGRERFRRRGGKSVSEAIDHFERALRVDERFAPAHAYLAIAATMLGHYGVLSLEEVRKIALPHLDRAQELAPDLADAHVGRGFLAGISGDPAGELGHLRKALAANPSDSLAMNALYLTLLALGRYEEAEIALKQMLVIDPLTYVGRFNYAEWLAQRGRFDEAHEMADQLSEGHLAMGLQSHTEISLIYEGNMAKALDWGLQFDRHTNSFSPYTMVPLAIVGEYDEARRIGNPVQISFLDISAGRIEQAIEATQENLRRNPDDRFAIAVAANALYMARRFDEALPLFERLLDFAPEGRPLRTVYPLIKTMQLALVLERTGDHERAQAIRDMVEADNRARSAAGRIDSFVHRTEAMLAAFEGDSRRANAALSMAIRNGERERIVFEDPIFEDLRDDPQFIALQKELEDIVETERDKVLQLICFNNPAPDNWQPLPETCEGAVGL